ncbi:VOC family protein [Ostreiculturibacter nitratireducens]|uniref:VOC family protein n=1 Tax=Ostreiculturibacter nitratireducens TaxID=3075226 RepID=UPI0031B5F830
MKIDYVELASSDIGATRDFLASAFGWGFVDYGPEYQAFADAGIDGGIDGTGTRAPGAPLVILKTDDLEAAEKKVREAGGTITAPIFTFPGGRRFHFREPGGNEMAVWSES